MNSLSTGICGGLVAVFVALAAMTQPPKQAAPGAGAPGPVATPPAPPPPLTLSARPKAEGGERLYVQHCGMCHGKGGMGTGLLARRADQPLLEERGDLAADFIIQAARIGIGNMPAVPRGEVSDADLSQIAKYLASPKPGRAR